VIARSFPARRRSREGGNDASTNFDGVAAAEVRVVERRAGQHTARVTLLETGRIYVKGTHLIVKAVMIHVFPLSGSGARGETLFVSPNRNVWGSIVVASNVSDDRITTRMSL
jgi:hypothetical protein